MNAERFVGGSFRILVLLASFLLFQVELLIARVLLPHFGSSASVWTTSLVFFQGALLLGYVYGAKVAALAARGSYRYLHVLLVLLPMLAFPFRVHIVPAGPTLAVLTALALSVGAPFIALSTTSIVAQAWFLRTEHPARSDPYFLYGTSNAGALLALLSYPLLVEPAFDLERQQWIWYTLYAAFIALNAIALRGVSPESAPGHTPPPSAPRTSLPRAPIGLWLLLSAAANALLMAVTNAVTADAPFPLLWIVPLTIYLATLVLCFARRMPSERAFGFLSVGGLLAGALALALVFRQTHLQLAFIALHGAGLWVGCLILHRTLVLSKPTDPRRLGTYYLSLSAGGVLGAVLIGLLMPVVFARVSTTYVDYAVAGALMLSALVTRDASALSLFARRSPRRALALLGAFAVFALVLVAAGVQYERSKIHGARTFYGLYSVVDDAKIRAFYHGNTIHGLALRDPDRRAEPIAYFHAESPVGGVLSSPLRRARVGLVGLGVGSLTAYGKPGDRWDVFELDGEIETIARAHFAFLANTKASVLVRIGDARITLEAIPDRSYDLLILDAFSSDYIPTHLLTREALELYLRKLVPDGLLLCHISNRFLDLRPVLTRQALDLELVPAWKPGISPETESEGKRESLWFSLARTPETAKLLDSLDWQRASASPELRARRPWTDQYVNLFHALN